MNKYSQYKIAFLILHYQNLEVTTTCVNNLKNLYGIENNYIVIVDNASPNGTKRDLKYLYKANKNIHIICLEKNIGFASGNNVGYKYAKNELNVDVVVAMNSDVFITDINFIYKLSNTINTYENSYIIAPDIIVKKGFHQNPYMKNPISNIAQKKILIRKYLGQFLYSIPMLNNKLIERRHIKEFQPNQKIKEMQIMKNIIPHGACIIYLPRWVNTENIAFVEGTFLFVEEELLYDYCLYKNYDTVYIPDLVVNHIEDASQDLINKNLISKKRNQIRNEIVSRKLLLKIRKEYKRGKYGNK